jgi:hypothetical protein
MFFLSGKGCSEFPKRMLISIGILNREQIEKSAQEILKARTLYPNSNLAALYDPLTMPAELRRAHTANDKAVMAAYGFSTKMTEADCVGELMKLYQKMQ